jgi:branched-chain amino acid transport system permease protein
MTSKIFFIVGVAILLSFPFLLNEYYIYILNIMGIYTILSLGLNLVMGFTGQISLGHAAFVAIGCYTTALLRVKLAVPFWVGCPAGALFAGIVGFAVGLPALRLRGHYLALATMGFGVSIQLIIFRWENLTGGARGFNMPPVSLLSFEMSSGKYVYYLIIPVVVFLTILTRNIVNSKTGRAFLAIRDSEIASQSMGVNLAKYKTLAFALSAF